MILSFAAKDEAAVRTMGGSRWNGMQRNLYLQKRHGYESLKMTIICNNLPSLQNEAK